MDILRNTEVSGQGKAPWNWRSMTRRRNPHRQETKCEIEKQLTGSVGVQLTDTMES